MVKKKGNIPFLLVILAAALIGLLFWKQGGLNEGEETGQPSPILTLPTDSTDTADSSMPAVEKVEEDSIETDSLTTIVPDTSSLTAAIDSISTTEPDTASNPPESAIGNTYHLLEVLKKDGILIYRINGEETDNVVATIAELDYTKPFVLKVAGNVTYAEEKEVKDILDVKEIAYTEQAF